MRNHYQLERGWFSVAAAAGVGATLTRLCALKLYFFIYLFQKDNSSGIIIQSCTVCAPTRRSWWGRGFASGRHYEWHLLVREKCILLHSAEALLHLHVNQAVGLIPKAPLAPAWFDSFITFIRRRKSDTCPSERSLIQVPEKQAGTVYSQCELLRPSGVVSLMHGGKVSLRVFSAGSHCSCCSAVGVDWLSPKVGV